MVKLSWVREIMHIFALYGIFVVYDFVKKQNLKGRPFSLCGAQGNPLKGEER